MSGIVSPDSLLSPTLTLSTQAVIRSAYGVLLMLTLLQAATQRKRFFCSERWGGYAQAGPGTDWIQNPVASRFVLGIWMGSALMLVLGDAPLPAAFINLLFARYFFIRMRWNGVLRGMGAPGFLTYWLGAVVFVLELTAAYAPDARPLALLVAQVDFAFIMLSAGVYKVTSGYARNHGMEYGLVNPEWGYWWQAYRKLHPDHWLFRVLNHLAWGTEVVGAILMLMPPTRFIGALLILFSFVFIALQIRLGFLCEMVMVATLIFFHDGSAGALLIDRLMPVAGIAGVGPGHPAFSLAANAALWTYLGLLPLAHAGLFYNFYRRRRLPGGLQAALDRYTNMFGLIIWRVFSVDVVNFYILIYRQPRAEPSGRLLVSQYGWRGGFRYSHVGESIAITSLFTTLKYYPTNASMFVDRLLRYARTVPCGADEDLVFGYVSIRKENDRFSSAVVAEFVVDVRAGSVIERVLDSSAAIRSPHVLSPVHEGARPGTYIPIRA